MCTKPAYTQKIKSVDSEKSPNLHILKKIKKKQKLIHLCQSVPHRVWFFLTFLSICRFGDVSLSTLLICLSIFRWCALLASKCWFFLSICRFCELQVSQTCIYSKKQKLIGTSHHTCIYSKKINILMPKVTEPAYTQKIKRKIRLYVGLTGIDELVFDFFDCFEYMQVWWLFTIKTFDFFSSICRSCALLASKCWSFSSICRFCALLASKRWSFLSICRFCAVLVVKIMHV